MEKYSPNWLLDKLNNSKTDTHKLMHIIDFQNNINENKPVVKMAFKEAPVGARFRYLGMKQVWVKINSYPKSQYESGDGLIAKWEGNSPNQFQNFCCFSDEENGIDFNTEIELI